MTTPAWTVRVAGGDAPTALIVERPDGSIVTEADEQELYTLINGQPEEPTDPNRPPGLSNGHCLITEEHTPHVATMTGDDGSPIEFWCTGEASPEAEAEAAAVEDGEG